MGAIDCGVREVVAIVGAAAAIRTGFVAFVDWELWRVSGSAVGGTACWAATVMGGSLELRAAPIGDGNCGWTGCGCWRTIAGSAHPIGLFTWLMSSDVRELAPCVVAACTGALFTAFSGGVVWGWGCWGVYLCPVGTLLSTRPASSSNAVAS
eukprot:375147-Amphidinium_carterae.1